eukprot:jgi/Orpsp1_1/1188008/evm.model.d7180000061804.1
MTEEEIKTQETTEVVKENQEKEEEEVTTYELEDEDFKLFEIPDDYWKPPPENTFQDFERNPEDVQPGTPSKINLRLIGGHSLWGHWIWNAALLMAYRQDKDKSYCKDKTVLELGAGGALNSFIAAINGAKNIVITDYPDKDLIENIEYNAKNLFPELVEQKKMSVIDHLWGRDVAPILALNNNEKFDLVLLADVIFNHNQQKQLLMSLYNTLKPKTGVALVYFTHHKPWIAHKDIEFFENGAAIYGFKYEEFETKVMKPMFEVDFGSELVRSTVHGYRMWLE